MDYPGHFTRSTEPHVHISYSNNLMHSQAPLNAGSPLLTPFVPGPMDLHSSFTTSFSGDIQNAASPRTLPNYSTDNSSLAHTGLLSPQHGASINRCGGSHFEPPASSHLSNPSEPLQTRLDASPIPPNEGFSYRPAAQVTSPHSGTYASPFHFSALQFLNPATADLTSLSSSSHGAPIYRCRWEGCTSATLFRREADLMRHLKTIHVSPQAYHCPVFNCDRVFGRKDHVNQHVNRRHRGDI
ncbi:hypothetical protein BDV19DRAFT_395302 [Aspergillus venezuelensis]